MSWVCRAVFVVALPDHGFVGIGGVPGLGAVGCAAVSTVNLACEGAFTPAVAARVEFGLGKLPRLGINNRLMRASHIVLRDFALVDLFGFGEEVDGETFL